MNKKEILIKVGIFASIVLNVIFFAAFLTQKGILSGGSNNKEFTRMKNPDVGNVKIIGYQYLAEKNPKFKEADARYRDVFNGIADDLVELKESLFIELTHQEVNQVKFEKLLGEITQLTGKLNSENYRYFLHLKEILDPQDYKDILFRMGQILHSDHEKHIQAHQEHIQTHQEHMKHDAPESHDEHQDHGKN